jgi:GNAT superfamily N-acetyltransferase
MTLSMGSVQRETIPARAPTRFPRYPIPTVHLGRLAVDRQCQGRGLGAILLVEAFRRSVAAASGIGAYAIDVFALHERAKSFYLKYGFVEMLDSPLHLLLPMSTVRAVVASYGA